MTVASILKEYSVSVTQHDTATERAEVSRENFAVVCSRLYRELGLPLSLLFATDERKEHSVYRIHALFAQDATHTRIRIETSVPADAPHYPSLTPHIMAAHWYERLMNDQFGIIAEGHPDWRRLMHHENIPAATYPLRKDFAWDSKLAHANEPYPMHAVTGKGIYEIPVGPIHAGIIEPGHFRFNVRGERILNLEGKLFFKHKGVEKLLEGKTPMQAMPFIEHVSGDMPVGHSLAFVQAIERALRIDVPKRALVTRTILNELERITMHIFDIGNIGGNGTGFTFMAAQGFRLVEELRRVHVRLTGDRFLRGHIIPGGLAKDISQDELNKTVTALNAIEKDLQKMLAIAYRSDGLMERFETTGVLSTEAAIAYGAQGVSARASGVDRDARRDFPYAAYAEKPHVVIATEKNGDVRARFDVRVKELKESFGLIRALHELPPGALSAPVSLKAGAAWGSAEAWRGEVIDWVQLNDHGTIDRCVVRDPSFCNWPLFGEIGPGNIVPDFPLCNKSLNLSYSGTDL